MDGPQINIEPQDEEQIKLLGEARSISSGRSANPPSTSLRFRSGSTIIEPVMLLFLVGKTLADTVVTNLIEYRTCRTEFELTDDNCTDPIIPFVEDQIQPTTANVVMARSLIEAFIPSCLGLLVGPWSDANGRKPFLALSLGGMTVSYLCWGWLAMVPDLSPHYLLLGSLPIAFTGGTCTVYLLIFCYITDVTDEHTRSLRLAVLGLIFNSSAVFGLMAAPLMIAFQNPSPNPYPMVFFLCSVLLLLATLYTIWGVRETVEIHQGRERRFLLWSHVTSLFQVCLRKRQGDARTMILLIISTLTLSVFVIQGEAAVMYLSTREMFSWKLADFSLYNSFASISSGLGTLVGVWFMRTVLQQSNMVSNAWVVSTFYARSVLFLMAPSSHYFYFAIIISFFFGAYSPFCRTELSKLVPSQDLGKVFALTAFLESMSPVVSAPLYTYVYNLTFLSAPSSVYWLSVAGSLLCVLFVTIGAFLQKYIKGECYIEAQSHSVYRTI